MKVLKPLNDQVVLKPYEEEQKYGNIIIPDNGEERPVTAEIVALSEGIYNYHTDRLIRHKLKVGDIVLIPKMGVHKISYENQEFYICQAQQLLAVISEE